MSLTYAEPKKMTPATVGRFALELMQNLSDERESFENADLDDPVVLERIEDQLQQLYVSEPYQSSLWDDLLGEEEEEWDNG